MFLIEYTKSTDWRDMKAFLEPLTPEEERACFEKKKNGDKSANEQLILHNMRLVAHVVKRYLSTEEDRDDLISIGTIGLIKAVDSFDPMYGSRFATYAIRCIENEILMYFRARKKRKAEVSLNEPIGTDKEGNFICLEEVLEHPDADVTLRIEIEDGIAYLKKNMKKTLTQREYNVVSKRYGLENQRACTQQEVADEMGISRSYVSRIETHALKKLRKIFEK